MADCRITHACLFVFWPPELQPLSCAVPQIQLEGMGIPVSFGCPKPWKSQCCREGVMMI